MTCLFALQDRLQNRNNVGGRLARPRLGSSQHVPAVDGQRDGLALHRRGTGEVLLGDGLEDARIEVHVGEGLLLRLLALLPCDGRGHIVVVELAFQGHWWWFGFVDLRASSRCWVLKGATGTFFPRGGWMFIRGAVSYKATRHRRLDDTGSHHGLSPRTFTTNNSEMHGHEEFSF